MAKHTEVTHEVTHTHDTKDTHKKPSTREEPDQTPPVEDTGTGEPPTITPKTEEEMAAGVAALEAYPKPPEPEEPQPIEPEKHKK